MLENRLLSLLTKVWRTYNLAVLSLFFLKLIKKTTRIYYNIFVCMSSLFHGKLYSSRVFLSLQFEYPSVSRQLFSLKPCCLPKWTGELQGCFCKSPCEHVRYVEKCSPYIGNTGPGRFISSVIWRVYFCFQWIRIFRTFRTRFPFTESSTVVAGFTYFENWIVDFYFIFFIFLKSTCSLLLYENRNMRFFNFCNVCCWFHFETENLIFNFEINVVYWW